MPNYAPHTKVTVIGVWDSSAWADMAQEGWQFGLRILQGTGPVADQDATAALIGPLIKSWWTGAASQCVNKAKLVSVKVANIGSDGKYLLPKPAIYSAGSVVGPATNVQPAIMSLAWTFETGHTAGLARRGRAYPPNMSFPLSGGTTVLTTSVNLNVGAAKAFLDACSGALSGTRPYRPVICSAQSPVFVDINGVSSDNAYDVQRRRKKQAVRTRSAVTAWP